MANKALWLWKESFLMYKLIWLFEYRKIRENPGKAKTMICAHFSHLCNGRDVATYIWVFLDRGHVYSCIHLPNKTTSALFVEKIRVKLRYTKYLGKQGLKSVVTSLVHQGPYYTTCISITVTYLSVILFQYSTRPTVCCVLRWYRWRDCVWLG